MWINLVGHLVFLLPFCAVMVWVSWAPVYDSWRVLEVSPDPDGLPRYPIKTLIPVAFCLLGLQGVSELITQWAAIRGVQADPLPPAPEPTAAGTAGEADA